RRREADRRVAVGDPGSGLISDRWRFGGGRAAGGDEAEGGDECGEQGGADQRRVPHVRSPAENGTRPLRWCRVISAAKDASPIWRRRKPQVTGTSRGTASPRPG